MRRAMVVGTAALLVAWAAPYAAAASDSPNYTYTKILDVGEWVRTSESQFSYGGTKILWNEREVDSVTLQNIRLAVKFGDWDLATKAL